MGKVDLRVIELGKVNPEVSNVPVVENLKLLVKTKKKENPIKVEKAKNY